MIEKIYHKKKLFALIVRSKFRKKTGINFFTEDSSNQQVGYMNHGKGHIIKPHRHKKRNTSKNDSDTNSKDILKILIFS